MKKLWLLVIFLLVAVPGSIGLLVMNQNKSNNLVDTSNTTVDYAPNILNNPQLTIDPCIATTSLANNSYQSAISSATSSYNYRVNFIPAMVMPGDPYNNGQMLLGSAKIQYNQSVHAAYTNYLITEKASSCMPTMGAPSYL